MEEKDYFKRIDENLEAIVTSHLAPENFGHHIHESFQLTYIIGGTTILEAEGHSYFIPARHFVWIPSGVEHRFLHRTKKPAAVYNFYFPKEEVVNEGFFGKIGIYPAPHLLIEVLRYADTRIVEKNSKEYDFISSFLKVLPDLCNDTFAVFLPISTNLKISFILDYILSNLEKELSQEGVASLFHISARTLNRLFREHIQMTFLNYVKHARMIRSMELLLEGDLNISEIALEVGYKSVAAYSNTFVEVTKKRPSEFGK